jgi:putative two-component system response regulator
MRPILFVDDERNVLEGIRIMLRAQRKVWDLTFVQNVDDALARIQETDFHAIISDLSMPEKNGFYLLEALRANGVIQKTPVVILTGNAEVDLKRRALDLGASDLLNKPVQADDLVARIRSVLRLRDYQDQLKSYTEFLEVKVSERTRELERSRRNILLRLAKAGEFRDGETGDHVIRVACCSRILATALGLESQLVQRIFMTSPLHDIGKIGIPDQILRKPGALTGEERKEMERHCAIGAAMLKDDPKAIEAFMSDALPAAGDGGFDNPDPLVDMASEIAMAHHEKWDGTGYPQGLRGEAIPLSGRIVAVSDVYDALRSERPYKSAFSIERTLEMLKAESGKHFDPAIVGLMDSVVGEFEAARQQYSA